MPEAIILAGGFGTRLRPLISNVPKPMAPVAGRPFLEILLDSLIRKGFSRFILSVGFMADKIINHFGERFSGVEIVYSVERAPLGTGGAIRLAMEKCVEDHVFVFNGDTYLDLEADSVELLWQETNSPIIVGREVADTSRYGRLLTNEGKIVGFAEKKIEGHGLINAGCYVLKKRQLENFPLYKKFSMEADYLAKVMAESPFELFITSGIFIDIGVPDDYASAQIELA